MLRSVCIGLFVLIWVAPLAALAAASEHTMVTSDGQVRISYTLSDNDSGFIDLLLDYARAGQVVRVRHTMTFQPVKGWSWSDMATARTDFFVTYSLFDDRFSVGASPDQMQEVGNIDDVRYFVLTVRQIPLVESAKLKTGDEYRVAVKATLEPVGEAKSGWMSYLPLGHVFRKELNEAFYYIAR